MWSKLNSCLEFFGGLSSIMSIFLWHKGHRNSLWVGKHLKPSLLPVGQCKSNQWRVSWKMHEWTFRISFFPYESLDQISTHLILCAHQNVLKNRSGGCALCWFYEITTFIQNINIYFGQIYFKTCWANNWADTFEHWVGERSSVEVNTEIRHPLE